MFIKIALIISVILQVGASIVALNLIKRTKYNISWISISIGFILMAFRRAYSLFLIFNSVNVYPEGMLSAWIAVLISLLMFIGVIFIRQIFNLQTRIDNLRKENETRVLSAIIRTEEETKKRFAKEIHDGLGPILSSVKMSVSAINKENIAPTNRTIIENTSHAIDEAILTVKEVSNNLSPHILQNYGLLKAIKTFIGNLTDKKTEINIFSNIEQKRYNEDIEIIFYRIICELITNSNKYAKTDTITIELFQEKNHLNLAYSDNGIGFDIDKVQKNNTGMGLSNIKSRIKSLNGQISMYSKPEEGFKINISVIAGK